MVAQGKTKVVVSLSPAGDIIGQWAILPVPEAVNCLLYRRGGRSFSKRDHVRRLSLSKQCCYTLNTFMPGIISYLNPKDSWTTSYTFGKGLSIENGPVR